MIDWKCLGQYREEEPSDDVCEEDSASEFDRFEVLYGQMLELSNPKLYSRMPYREYLQTDYWHLVRRALISKRGLQCQCCGRMPRWIRDLQIEAHHLTYANRGNEFRNLDDLALLCRDCHQNWHGIAKGEPS